MYFSQTDLETGSTPNLLLVVPNGQLQVSRYNTLLLVVACSIASQLKDLSRKVFEDGSEVNFGSVESFLLSTTLRQDSPGAPFPMR